MTQVVRTWLALSAIGAGLIHLALVVSSSLAVAIVFAMLGVAELVWGVAMLAGSRLFTPRIALAVALVPLALGGFGFSVGVLPTEALVPFGFAAVLELFVAVSVAIALRRGINDVDVARPAPPAGRYVLGVLVGALAVAGITTPALAATEAGAFAQPHGEHSSLVPAPGEHGH